SKNYDLHATIDKVLYSHFAIDHSAELKKAIAGAQTILYLGDNNGEIVFDKLFIETVGHPDVYFAVRGAPVINDVTLDDARYVGIDKVAKVISNGYDAPSTIVEHCSDEFRHIFEKADIVISKGQGNLEGLLHRTQKEVYFMLMVKCNVIADALQVNKGDFVVKKNSLER
ncbi:MAG TPA: ARMT1-like domain-containing protein, partial [Bacteroidales bacterium]